MKNLKRILSLALASVMVMGMMVVGASAAEFNDQDKIDHQTAVNTLVALGVIKGKENNNFDPEGKLTRAEMATVLAVILNKGKAPNFGIKEKPTYSDIDGHWAESYIEYCSAFSVVGGIGGGKFNPEGTLKSTEAARMILNAMGYTIEDPSNWALLTEAQARGGDLDLYNGLDEITDPTQDPMTRDQMAQMLFNALSAPVVDKNGNTMTYTKAEKQTVSGAPYYIKAIDTGTKIKALEGKEFGSWAEAWAVATSTVAADGQPAEMGTDFEINATSTTRTVTTTEIQTLGNRYLGITETAGMVTSVKVGNAGYDITVKTASGNVSFTGVEENIASLMGQNAKVLYKNGDVNSVYGVFAQGSKVVFEGAFGDFTAIDNLTATQNKTVTLDGDKVAAADTVTMYVFNDFAKADVHTNVNAITRTNTNAVKEWALKAVANNADGKVDTIVVTPVEATKVANKTSSNLVVSPAVDGKSTIALKATSGAENVVKGDYILVTPMANAVSKTYEIVKAEIVSGTVTGKRTGEYLLDNGEWYSAASTLLPGSKTPSLGAELSLVLVNGYYVYAYAADEANEAANLMILTSVAKDATTSGFTTYVAAKAIFLSDGEEHEIKLPISAFNTAIDSNNKLTYTLKNDTVNQLQTYKVEKDGTYTLNATIDPVKDLNLTGVVNDVQYKNGKIDDGTDKYNIADDAVVIVVYKNATKTNTSNTNVTSTVADLTKAGVITGKDLKTWGNITWGATTGIGKAYTGKVSGLNYAKVIYLAADAQTLPNAAGTTDNYGWIMTAPYTTKVKDTEYQTYKLWTGAETVTVNDKNTSNLSLGIGDVITYTDMGDGIIDSTSKTVKTGAVTGYGESVGLIDILDATSKNQTGSVTIDEDTVILFIDTENKVGVDGGAIRLADESELKPGEYANNVHYILNGTGDKVLLLVVETNNDLGSKVDITVPVVVTKDLKSTTFEVTSVTYNNDTKVVKGAASNITLDAKPGMTITLTMKATAADTKTITISDGSNNIGTKASATYAVGDEFTVSCTVQAAGTLVINEA